MIYTSYLESIGAVLDYIHTDKTTESIERISNYLRILDSMKADIILFPTGIPDFIKLPPSTLEVDENSKLQLSVYMDGHPKPSVYFKWSHLTKSSKVPGVRLYPYIYSSIYTISSIDGGYCGRVLQTTIKNAIGSSSTTDTMVIILCKFDAFQLYSSPECEIVLLRGIVLLLTIMCSI